MDNFEIHALKHPRFRQPLERILQSHEYVEDLHCSAWDFAVAWRELQEQGLSANDVRWLLGREIISLAVEIAPRDGQRRSFQSVSDWRLPPEACFILTPYGVDLLQRIFEEKLCERPSLFQESQLENPKWDSLRRTLYFGEFVVKEYRVPAPNQELVLSAFEEEKWPYRIDDPLPHADAIVPKRRLHDTIIALNRRHRCAALRFHGDGQGEGICWKPAG